MTRDVMRLLVLNHFFDQDIESLGRALSGRGDLRVLPYELLRDEALKELSPDVTHGLDAFASPENAAARERYSQRLTALLADEYSRSPFDAFVSPSDVFFYVRAAPSACHRLGVPFFVAQKETTISDHTMAVHSQRVREFAPPIADHMTVCSERHREFWLRAGAEPATVTVTGQPRFDFYAGLEQGPPAGPKPTVLFFSYMTDAYHPTEGGGEPVWAELHRQTESALWELAREGWRVVVKPHPQQEFRREKRRIGAALGSERSGVILADPLADARKLIAGADVVVGFQTTALFEALVAERPVVYTGWDPEAQRIHDALIPFDEWPDVIDVVRAPGDLANAIRAARGTAPSDEQVRRRLEIAEQQLGPIDGRASTRTLDVLEAVVRRFEHERTAEAAQRRAELEARRAPLHLRRRLRQNVRDLRRAAGAKLGR